MSSVTLEQLEAAVTELIAAGAQFELEDTEIRGLADLAPKFPPHLPVCSLPVLELPLLGGSHAADQCIKILLCRFSCLCFCHGCLF